MKTRWMHLIAGFTMFVLCISICTTTSNASIDWEDNFDDYYLDDWTIYGYTNATLPRKIEGNFSAASGMLEVLDNDINIARHNSTTNLGTWSFDMFVPDDGYGAVYVHFMSNGSSMFTFGNTSFVAVGAWLQEDEFILWQGKEYTHLVLAHINETLQGWHHIDVSRTSEGRFLVSFNGTLKADVASTGLTFTITSSTYLQVVCNNVTGAAIDNLVVRDNLIPHNTTTTTTTTTTTPTTTTPTTTTTTTTPVGIDPIIIGLVGGIGVGVVAILILFFVRKR